MFANFYFGFANQGNTEEVDVGPKEEAVDALVLQEVAARQQGKGHGLTKLLRMLETSLNSLLTQRSMLDLKWRHGLLIRQQLWNLQSLSLRRDPGSTCHSWPEGYFYQEEDQSSNFLGLQTFFCPSS